MRAGRLISPILLCGGAALIAIATLRGAASASVVVIVPVFTGSSLIFFGGILCLVAGFATLPLTLGDGAEFVGDEPTEPGESDAETDRTAGPTFGGAVVIGPVPILFGRWRDAPRWWRWGLAAVGLALLFAVLFLIFPFRW